LNLSGTSSEKEPEKQRVLKDTTIESVADAIKEGKCKKIIVMTGAGISVAAGIPDFRTPGAGLYDNLQKYNLPYPEAVFHIGYFKQRPEPFYALAKEMWPSTFRPTPVHFFIKLLEKKNILLRCFTQNIDTLERVAGILPENVIEAHGSFGTSSCIGCDEKVTEEWLKEKVFSDQIPKCEKCGSLIKPDITFFGQNLPKRFFNSLGDFDECDLLLVIGTSLQVHPFAGLVENPGNSVPRVLINREEVGNFRFEAADNDRDVKFLGDCQDSIKHFAKLLGWEDELDELIVEGGKRHLAQNHPTSEGKL